MFHLNSERLEPRLLFSVAAPPVATAYPHDVEADGSTYYDIPFQFYDPTGINRDGIARSRTLVRIAGPNDYRAYGNLWALDGLNGEPEIFGHYSITPPGGSWTSDDVGTYKITLLGDALKDTDGNATPAMKIGSFHVTASQTSPGPLPGSAAVVGRYRGTLAAGDATTGGATSGGADSSVLSPDFDLTLNAVHGNRVEGIYHPSPSDPNGPSIAVHGTLKAGGKISLVGDASAGNTHLSIVGRLSNGALKGNIFADLEDGIERLVFSSKRR